MRTGRCAPLGAVARGCLAAAVCGGGLGLLWAASGTAGIGVGAAVAFVAIPAGCAGFVMAATATAVPRAVAFAVSAALVAGGVAAALLARAWPGA